MDAHETSTTTTTQSAVGDKEKASAKPSLEFIAWDSPEDPHNPQNFSYARKLFVTAIWVAGNLVTCIASSIFSSGSSFISKEFDVSSTVTTLGISLFLLGYTVGPPVWGPLSERFGRKWPMLSGMALFTVFCLPVALAKNIQTALIGRFFCGMFGAAPLSIAGGGLVDIWNPVQRGVALAACIGTIFGSPILAPLMGNFIAASYLGWRWTQWLSAIMGLAASILVLLGLPETHAPTLLRAKAARLRRETSDPTLRSQYDGGSNGVSEIVQIYLVRSFAMLATEPILVLITIYQAFIYGILYLVFVSYPIAFREVRHWALGVSALPYLGMMVGVVLGCATVVYHTKTHFAAKARANGGVIVPEQRLPLMIGAGCLLPVGLFIFAWTSDPDVHWTGMVVGSVPVGMAMYMIFVQCLNYLVDVYQTMANSAIGANTFVRSFFGAGFPLFGPAMYHHLGVAWATSVLAFVAIAMIPIPVLFFKYGHTIRQWSKNTVNKV
ncbi:major facilitator superfamily domain-containing protein [Macrophomina phaseolina]|uniref:Major facilitator superfamily domain-containing protein n=1 Tax=Macrophomina phaseolina TaxID=35725 RepID=A0ABQ8FQ72_9PEZI|nr:major facilitator superfamily domain-containing protein [Macrophomina phaseolina]